MAGKCIGNSLIVGTHVLKLKEPAEVKPAEPSPPVPTGSLEAAANNQEPGSSQVMPRDPKYTQPRWCPLGITKMQRRKLQRLRNQEKAEKEAERFRDESFNRKRPMIPSRVWVKKTDNMIIDKSSEEKEST